MTPKHQKDICLLQSKAESMTFEEFFAWVRKNCSGITLMGDFADFDYGSITATIDAKNDCLCGRFDCWDESGSWEDTIECGSVSFKK